MGSSDSEYITRLLKERGFETADDTAVKNKRRQRINHRRNKMRAPTRVLLAALCFMTIISGCIIASYTTDFNASQPQYSGTGETYGTLAWTNMQSTANKSSNYNGSVAAELINCTNNAPKTTSSSGDAFYAELLAYYDYVIQCYQQYDSQNIAMLTTLKNNRSNVISGIADHEEYKRTLQELDQQAADHDRETEEYFAQLDALSKQQEEEQARRQAEQAAAEEAQKIAAEKAAQEKIAQCESAKATLGGLSAREKAEQDTAGLAATWSAAQSKAQSAARSCTSGSNVVLNADQRARCQEKANSYQSAALSAYQNYNSALIQRESYYNSLLKACN